MDYKELNCNRNLISSCAGDTLSNGLSTPVIGVEEQHVDEPASKSGNESKDTEDPETAVSDAVHGENSGQEVRVGVLY